MAFCFQLSRKLPIRFAPFCENMQMFSRPGSLHKSLPRAGAAESPCDTHRLSLRDPQPLWDSGTVHTDPSPAVSITLPLPKSTLSFLMGNPRNESQTAWVQMLLCHRLGTETVTSSLICKTGIIPSPASPCYYHHFFLYLWQEVFSPLN